MGIYSAIRNADASVLANYQAFHGDIYDQIPALGWVQTADTGQTNPRTVGALPATGAATNFAIFKTNDGLTPVYLKVAFMRTAGNQFQVQVSIGTGTDGAGNLTGNVVGPFSPNCALATGTANLYLSGETGGIRCIWNPEQVDGNYSFSFCVSRSKDGTGANTSSHATLFSFGFGSLAQQTMAFAGGTNGQQQSHWRATLPSPEADAGNWASGTHMGFTFSTPMPLPYGANPTHDVGMWGMNTPGLTRGTIITIPIYGANHDYLVCNEIVEGSGYARSLMRYE